MIEPTDEMKAAFHAAQEQRAAELVAEGAPLGAHDILDRGLAAVLTLIERDYNVYRAWCGVPCPEDPEERCELIRGHDGPHWVDVLKVTW